MRQKGNTKKLSIEQRRQQFAMLKQLFGGVHDDQKKNDQSEKFSAIGNGRATGIDQVDSVSTGDQTLCSEIEQ